MLPLICQSYKIQEKYNLKLRKSTRVFLPRVFRSYEFKLGGGGGILTKKKKHLRLIKKDCRKINELKGGTLVGTQAVKAPQTPLGSVL